MTDTISRSSVARADFCFGGLTFLARFAGGAMPDMEFHSSFHSR